MEKKLKHGSGNNSHGTEQNDSREPGFLSGLPEDLFSKSFNSLPQASLIINDDFLILHLNHAADFLLKKNAQSRVGKSIFSILKFRFAENEEELRSLISQESNRYTTLAKSIVTELNYNILIIPLAAQNGTHYLLQVEEAIEPVSVSPSILPGNDDNALLTTGFPTDFNFEQDNGFLQTIIDSLPHPFYVMDAVSKKALIRNQSAILFEASLGSVDCYMKEKPESCNGDAFACALNMVISSSAPVRIDHEYIYKSGERHIHEVFGYPVFSSSGSLKYLIQYSIDITQRKRNEAELHEYRVIIDNLMSNLPGMAFRCLNEANWTMEYVSPGCKKITGYIASELVNNKKVRYGDLIHEDDRERVWYEVQDAVSKHRFYRIEYRIITKYGKTKWVLKQGKGMYDKYDNLVRLEGLVTDITESKNAELLLKKELAINQGIAKIGVELLKDPIKPARVAYMVQYYTRLLTGSKFSLLISSSSEGENSYMYCFEEGNEKELSRRIRRKEANPGIENGLIDKLVAEKQPIMMNEPGIIPKIPCISSGELIFTRLLSIPAFINNQHAGVLILADAENDYTEKTVADVQRFINMFALALYRLKTEESLRIAKEKAEESDRQKTLFLSNMSHEIRTPMNAIVGFAEMLQDSQLSIEEKDRFLDVIIKSGDNLLHLINDIIDISKIEAGELKIIYSDCYLNELFAELQVFFLHELSRMHKEHLTLYMQPGNSADDFAVYTDPVRVRQIITNLVSNAIKFTDEGFIEIGYRIKNENLEFYVRDSGIGIPVDHQKLIFERFAQVRDAVSRNLSGTGLGLTISKNLAELLGGTMWLDSFPDEGSTFWFTIPLKVGRQRPANFSDHDIVSRPEIDLSGKCILIVEDVDTNYFYISSLLSKYNCRVLRATNGVNAIELCRTDPSINLVLMDIELPLMNGYEATQQIKLIRPDLPVIAQTAFAMTGERERSEEAGCDDYIAKPIRKEVLLESIARFI